MLTETKLANSRLIYCMGITQVGKSTYAKYFSKKYNHHLLEHDKVWDFKIPDTEQWDHFIGTVKDCLNQYGNVIMDGLEFCAANKFQKIFPFAKPILFYTDYNVLQDRFMRRYNRKHPTAEAFIKQRLIDAYRSLIDYDPFTIINNVKHELVDPKIFFSHLGEDFHVD